MFKTDRELAPRGTKTEKVRTMLTVRALQFPAKNLTPTLTLTLTLTLTPTLTLPPTLNLTLTLIRELALRKLEA